LKVTVPVAPLVTVAVNVTDCPTTLGFAELASAVVLADLLTVTVFADDVLPEKLPSPAYTAVIVWLPAVRFDFESVACPDDTEPVPSVVEPSLNVTVPVAVPAAGAVTAMVAVNTTV
jgi:hypothetical protein